MGEEAQSEDPEQPITPTDWMLSQMSRCCQSVFSTVEPWTNSRHLHNNYYNGQFADVHNKLNLYVRDTSIIITDKKHSQLVERFHRGENLYIYSTETLLQLVACLTLYVLG